MGRKYLPTLGELIDRLTIVQLKEVKIPQHKKEYEQEIKISYMISIRYYWMKNLKGISLMVI